MVGLTGIIVSVIYLVLYHCVLKKTERQNSDTKEISKKREQEDYSNYYYHTKL